MILILYIPHVENRKHKKFLSNWAITEVSEIFLINFNMNIVKCSSALGFEVKQSNFSVGVSEDV